MNSTDILAQESRPAWFRDLFRQNLRRIRSDHRAEARRKRGGAGRKRAGSGPEAGGSAVKRAGSGPEAR